MANLPPLDHPSAPQPQPLAQRTITLPAFGYGIERAGPDGKGRIIRIILTNPADTMRLSFDVLELAMEGEAARDMSAKLLAPSMSTADASELPETSEG